MNVKYFLVVLVIVMAFISPIWGSTNEKFSACCKKHGIKAPCLDYCNYRHKPHKSFTKKIVAAYKKGICKFETDGPFFQQCFNNEKDNRGCCKAAGITGACLDLCDGSKTYPYDPKYIPCSKAGDKVYRCAKASH